MNKSVALVLSSGGSKGLAQIGVINALKKNDFQISSIAGSSIGSVIGGLYAMGKLPEFTAWIKTLDRRAIWGLMDFTISTYGLLKAVKALDKMKTFIPDVNIEEMGIPFAAIATDIINEKEIVFNSGSFYEAIRASIAIPTVITPVRYRDTILVDGGVLNPIPIMYVARSTNDILVVVNLYGEKSNEKDKPDMVTNNQNTTIIQGVLKNISKLIVVGDKRSFGYYSLLKATTSAMVHKIAKQNIELSKPDILINIPYDSSDTFDFHKAEELIKIGETAANEAISNYFKNHEL
jgi:NTE family protein